jgi:hypothetical protein
MRPSGPAALLLLSALLATTGSAAEEPPARKGPPPTGPDTPFPERVGKAIDAGVAWLKGRAGAKGSFGPLDPGPSYTGESESYRYPAGPTALALYALLKCGVPPSDPVIAKAFAWLREREETPTTSYEISVLLLALEARAAAGKDGKPPAAAKGGKPSVRPSAADLAWMRRLAAQLLRRKQARPGWRYNMAAPAATGEIQSAAAFGGDLDASSTQLAILGLAAAERCGIAQPDAVYLDVLRWTLGEQEPEGPAVVVPGAPGSPSSTGDSAVADRARGWGYLPRAGNPDQEPTGSMTACALATLSVTGSILSARGNREWKGGLEAKADRAWRDGSAWFVRNWNIPRNPGNGSAWYYWLYCLERAGDLRGVSLLGGHDWYGEGAAFLLEEQYPDGSWWSSTDHPPSDLLGTCYALLFLKRSSRAVATATEPSPPK